MLEILEVPINPGTDDELLEKFFADEELEIIQPGKPYFKIVPGYMENDKGESIESAPHAQMTVRFKCETPVGEGAMIRKVSK